MGNSKSKGASAPEGAETVISFEDKKKRKSSRKNKTKAQEPEAAGATSKPVELPKGPLVAQDDETSSPPKVDLAAKSKKAANRLGVDISSNKAFANEKPVEGTAVGRKASRLFAAPKAERSKIYQALNPEKLFFESRREQEEKGKIELGRVGARDYNMLRDEDGNVIPEESDNEEYVDDEADYDTDDAPDFGELEAEMQELRKRRAAAEEQKREQMRKEWEAKKAAEEAERQAELDRIRAKEAQLAAQKEENNDDFVVQAQAKVAQETGAYFSGLSFN
eukprot:TRINITY_DN7712_c0_g1_i3.p1 TRINITY_DN7712_c0_g1~~TRINITY_DN7712_c0_g1_i3.p1  ORF type:complete len:278 (+),score=96.64 TRINITY_DN7712_c0_g1_i3:159-992(+)